MLSSLVSGFWGAIICSCSQIKTELENNLPQPLLRWSFFLSSCAGLSNKFSSCQMRSLCNRSHTKLLELLLSQPYFRPEQWKCIIRFMLICHLSERCFDRCYYHTGTFPCLYTLGLFYVSRAETFYDNHFSDHLSRQFWHKFACQMCWSCTDAHIY